MNSDYYTYRVSWSAEDEEHVATCLEFPSLSWLAKTPEAALLGIRELVRDVILDMKESGENIPQALAEKSYSGEFRIRIPPELHRQLTFLAAEQGVSLNRFASMRLANLPFVERTTSLPPSKPKPRLPSRT